MLKELGVQIDIVPRLFEMIGPSVGIHTVEGLPLLGLPPAQARALVAHDQAHASTWSARSRA